MPAVAGLKKQGANNGASLSFLISTPETGIDSIALTYSLLGPAMALIRPVAAFFTAMAAGLLETFFNGLGSQTMAETAQQRRSTNGYLSNSCLTTDACARSPGLRTKLYGGLRFAFEDLMSDLVVWFLLGILLAGLITALIPESFLSERIQPGLLSYLAVMLVSLPMYVCATMSTPIAAALIAKGMSPGTALVLLLAGPATNMATLIIVAGTLGRRSLVIYLLSIVGCTLLFAFGTDALYESFGTSHRIFEMSEASELLPWWVEVGSSFALAALMIRIVIRKGPTELIRKAFSATRGRDSLDDFSPEPCAKAGGS